METATISEVKNRLSAYLRKVKAGQTVLILDRDEPVAMITAVDAQDRPADRLAKLEKQGLLRRSASTDPLKALKQPVTAKTSVVLALLEDRRDAR
ncbi:MAG: type II toxin-antitoxin system prevent-host-death family antitoxin [Gammaproteobacteria bacterium]|nr:MAG: type II toxin-antitoxin system prevent-host-death family antitoxin [Gammaproteobacteria bacterium]TDJ42138.1 MAG: type II toxin-antitoxin system prevent-host-death family antitoxin [Gammaproteobacteria bacterium]